VKSSNEKYSGEREKKGNAKAKFSKVNANLHAKVNTQANTRVNYPRFQVISLPFDTDL
jgi:hypothetical protein